MRVHQFAQALSARGHRVALLTGGDPSPGASSLASVDIAGLIERHGWHDPLILPAGTIAGDPLEHGGRRRWPQAIRKMDVAWRFLTMGGQFGRWTKAVEPLLSPLVSVLQPQVIWTTFGNTDNLTVAKRAATLGRCPWVMDFKDNWEAFIPAYLRRHMAWRYRGAAAVTANAEHHLSIARRWHRQSLVKVVYSGVSETLFETAREAPVGSGTDLLLVGGTYNEANLRQFLAGVSAWLALLPQESRSLFRLRYAGGDSSRVREAVREAGLGTCSTIDGYLPLHELAHLARNSFACSYLWAPVTFHHKLLELLVVGRQVIAFPGEHAESRRMAQGIDTPFRICPDRDSVVDALQTAWADRAMSHGVRSREPAWRWSDFAVDLEGVLDRVSSR